MAVLFLKMAEASLSSTQVISNRDIHAREVATRVDGRPDPRHPPRKYSHLLAVHSKARSSCLGHESENVPSFLGFRNLMVLALGEDYLVFHLYISKQTQAYHD